MNAFANAEPRTSRGEEIANSASHGLGLLACLASGPFLVARATTHGDAWAIIGTSVFIGTCAALYLASTLYHALPRGRAKRVFRTIEHGAIFLMIAGAYTPFTLVWFRGVWGWSLFGLAWSLAGAGIVLKAACVSRYRWLPGVLYLGLAWLIMLAIWPLWQRVPFGGLMWLLAGGVIYTLGMGFFAATRVPYSHFVWDLFVMGGTTCHFIAVWGYIA